MEAPPFRFLLLFLLFIFSLICTSGSFLSDLKDITHKEVKRADEQKTLSYRRELIQTIQHDFMNPTFPTTPVTNPVTTPNPVPVTNPVTTPNPDTGIAPPDILTPPVVTVPPGNPPATTTPDIPVTFPPVTDPVNPQTPITNPVTTPSPTNPGGQPVINAPAVPGQSWCVARGGLPEATTQAALDYACGFGGADCSAIQQGASCYNPPTLQSHASYAFNSYYQRNPVQTSCDFGGAAMITNINPSSGSCVFPTWSSSSASPTTMSPIPITTPTPTPTTESSSGVTPTGWGTPPNALTATNPPTNPALGGGITGYGESPPTAGTSLPSKSSSLQPFNCFIVVVISIITGRIVLNI